MSEHQNIELWNQKRVLWQNSSGYRIVSGNQDNTYLTLWTHDNVKVGELSAVVIQKKHPSRRVVELRAKIKCAEIRAAHRGQRLGLQLYAVMLSHLPEGVCGLYSHLPDRSNHRQVPRIYAALRGYVLDGDHAFVDK